MSLFRFHRVHQTHVWCHLVKEYSCKFVKTESSVSFSVVLLDDILNLFFCHCLSKLLHREIDICVSDIPRVVGIELLENSMQFLFGHVMSYIDGG